MSDSHTASKILPGTYEVPRQVDEHVAELALSLGWAVIVPKAKKTTKKRGFSKKAPENKIFKGLEDK
jgi:hypothetical protein